jgi:hypothetical protein
MPDHPSDQPPLSSSAAAALRAQLVEKLPARPQTTADRVRASLILCPGRS